MSVAEHVFTAEIYRILGETYQCDAKELLAQSHLLQYLNIKTKAANRGSKSRAGFANHYAIYVLIEDYINKKFDINGNYESYEGAQFSQLFKRQRELPFGSKLQNHALNHRLNEEFKKHFPAEESLPIIRDVESNRYWINEKLLKINIGDKQFNIAKGVAEIIQHYVSARMDAFNSFINECSMLLEIKDKDTSTAIDFIKGLLRPNVDARVFEIVSYAILKQHYAEKILYWGWSPSELNEEFLVLYKTGRTNANDGGIDFVMKPLGRFFQVTETVDSGKYFLDIDKVQRYPITFVVKTEESPQAIQQKIRNQAKEKYSIEKIVERYVSCVEEIINVPILISYFDTIVTQGKIKPVIEEIILQSRVEFNVEEEGDNDPFHENAEDLDAETE
jgi:hypothetical protein